MGRIREISKRDLTTWEYNTPQIYNNESACKWIEMAKAIPDFEPRRLTVDDLVNTNEEGNASKRLPVDATAVDIFESITESSIDSITVVGRYKGARTVLGVNIRRNIIAISLENDKTDLISDLEFALGLHSDVVIK